MEAGGNIGAILVRCILLYHLVLYKLVLCNFIARLVGATSDLRMLTSRPPSAMFCVFLHAESRELRSKVGGASS